jgi:polyphenol oxidase
MAMVETDGLKYFQFQSFQAEKLAHGIFTRHGGVSPAPWDSLNVGGLNGDPRENVVENRRRVFAALGRPVESVFDVWQVHSEDIIVATAPRGLDTPHSKADAIITNLPEVTLFMRFGDCVPILFYDPARHVAGIAHAGWQGTVNMIAAQTVKAMCQTFGCQPGDILAGIGPSIGVDHYEVGEDVIRQVKNAFGEDSKQLLVNRPGKISFDLWKTNALILENAGVKQVEIASICTACHVDDWFSHRGDKGKTGRFGALLGLK